MNTGLRERSVLVTGGTRGIGRAIALAYAGEGARVAITYASDDEAASETVAMLEASHKGAASFYLDLEDNASIEVAVQGAVAVFGGLDILVANAVRWPLDARAPLAEADHADWTRALRANLEGTTLTVRAALPHLARSTAGRIVLISSGVARDGRAGATAYSTAKAALDGSSLPSSGRQARPGSSSTSSAPASPSPRTTSPASATRFASPCETELHPGASRCPKT
jgi:NAD(P)-dependent dehydrogenase (short-subunit alcohol dehydrogenase family)